MNLDRRNFVKLVGGSIAAGSLGTRLAQARRGQSSGEIHKEIGNRKIPTIALDGLAISHGEESRTFELLDMSREQGILFWDTAMNHIAGRSERRMGKYLAGAQREEIFIQSRTKARSKPVAKTQLNLSLARLRTDYLDSFLINSRVTHKVDDQFEIPDDDTFEALIEAKAEGKIRKIGLRTLEDTSRIYELFAMYGKHIDVVMAPFALANDATMTSYADSLGFDLVADVDIEKQREFLKSRKGAFAVPAALSSWVMAMKSSEDAIQLLEGFEQVRKDRKDA